jgi:hypothetical protein
MDHRAVTHLHGSMPENVTTASAIRELHDVMYNEKSRKQTLEYEKRGPQVYSFSGETGGGLLARVAMRFHHDVKGRPNECEGWNERIIDKLIRANKERKKSAPIDETVEVRRRKRSRKK